MLSDEQTGVTGSYSEQSLFMMWQWRANSHAQADTTLSNDCDQEDPVLNFPWENYKFRKQKAKFVCAFRPQNRTKNVNKVETFELLLIRRIVQNIVEINHYAQQVQNSSGHSFPWRSYVHSVKTVTEKEVCVVFEHTFTPTFQSLSKSKKTLNIRNK